MILQPTWICGWRQDRLVDPIKIMCTDSPTLRSRTCGWPVVSQPLGAPNQYQVPSLKSSWPCNNTWLISSKNMSNFWWTMNNSVKWSWTWDHRWVVLVRPIFGRMVPGMTSLLLQRRHCSSLIFICTNKIVMNIWILYYSILFLHISILYNLICLIIFFFIILYNFILMILYNFIF
jgi:hypothetical protein